MHIPVYKYIYIYICTQTYIYLCIQIYIDVPHNLSVLRPCGRQTGQSGTGGCIHHNRLRALEAATCPSTPHEVTKANQNRTLLIRVKRVCMAMRTCTRAWALIATHTVSKGFCSVRFCKLVWHACHLRAKRNTSQYFHGLCLAAHSSTSSSTFRE